MADYSFLDSLPFIRGDDRKKMNKKYAARFEPGQLPDNKGFLMDRRYAPEYGLALPDTDRKRYASRKSRRPD
jgi:hypothetical protein